MQYFSKKFYKLFFIEQDLLDSFLDEAMYTKYFDEDTKNDLLYFALNMYEQDTIFKIKMNKVIFLREVAKLLNQFSTDKITSLNRDELSDLLPQYI